MLSSQPLGCADCEGQLRIAQAARTALFPPPILPSSSHRSIAPARTRAEGLKRRVYDVAPSIPIFAHSTLSDAVAVSLTAELARLHREVTRVTTTAKTTTAPGDCSSGPTFQRFFDLPAEIRNLIYEHVVSKDCVLRLRCFVLPGICRASRQLREESLSLFFKQNHFVAEVKTNFEGITACPTHGSHAQYITIDDKWRFRLAGKLDLNRVVEGMLATCHPRLIKVRNIDFCMLAVNRVKRRDEQYRYAILSVRHDRSNKVSTHIKEGNDAEYTKHLRRVIKQGRSALDDIVSVPSYNGLTMLNMREVAATFVADPRERSTRLRREQAQQPIHESIVSAGASIEEFDLLNAEVYFDETVSKITQSAQEKPPELLGTDGEEFELAEAESYFT